MRDEDDYTDVGTENYNVYGNENEKDYDNEDDYDENNEKAGEKIITERLNTRLFRLKNTDLEKIKPSKPLVPRLGLVSTDQETHLSRLISHISIDPESANIHKVKRYVRTVLCIPFASSLSVSNYYH